MTCERRGSILKRFVYGVKQMINAEGVLLSPSTLNLQAICDAFNRLERLELEGHHDGQKFYVSETVWALLTSMGVVIDMNDVDRILLWYGQMLDGSFRELNAEELAIDLEGFPRNWGASDEN